VPEVMEEDRVDVEGTEDTVEVDDGGISLAKLRMKKQSCQKGEGQVLSISRFQNDCRCRSQDY